MDHQETAPIRSDLLRLSRKPHARKFKSKPIAENFFMITRDIDHLSPMAGHAQNEADDLIMMIIPVPGTPQAPPVNDVTNQIELFALNLPQKIDE
jgi:hypothetical protein